MGLSVCAQETEQQHSLMPETKEKILRLLSEADSTKEVTIQLKFLLEAVKALGESKDAALIYELNFRIGQVYAFEKLNDRALLYFKIASANYTNDRQEHMVYGALASVYDQLGIPDSSAIYLRDILNDLEKDNNYEGQLETRQQLIATYLNNKKYQQALTENFKLKELVEEQKDKNHLPIIYNNIGYNFNSLKNHTKAVEYFEYAEQANEDIRKLDLATLYTNIGIASNNIGDLKKALKYLGKAKSILNKKNDGATAVLDHLISQIYLNNKDLYNAKLSNEQAIQNARKFKQDEILVDVYNTAALIYQDLYDYELALDFYKKHLNLRDSFRLESRLRQERLLQQQFLLEQSEKEIKLLLVNQEVQSLAIAQLQLEKDKIFLEKEKQASELEVFKKSEEARTANLKNAELEKDKAQKELQLTAGRLEAEKQNRTIFELEQKSILTQAEIERNKAELARKEAETAQKQKENELLQANAEIYKKNESIKNLELEKQGTRLKFLFGIGALFLLLAIVALKSYLNSKKQNKQLAAKNTEIAKSRDIIAGEREKSENLLLNILPKETAAELKESGAATPRFYEKVTVLFTDFSGFTRISRHMSPEDLLEELNECFRGFDEILDDFGLEKIKTLGDGYMAAGGIPVPNDTNPIDAVRAAVRINEFMIKRASEKRAQGIEYWDTRIGLHTGKVVAGVVGSKKFAYDIWGDTVNTASRMESGGEIGKVNISVNTYELVKEYFKCNYRGEIEIKNRGKIKMYFVEEEIA